MARLITDRIGLHTVLLALHIICLLEILLHGVAGDKWTLFLECYIAFVIQFNCYISHHTRCIFVAFYNVHLPKYTGKWVLTAIEIRHRFWRLNITVVRKMQLTAGVEMGMPRSNEAGSVLELDSGIPLMDERRASHTTLVGP